MAGLVLYSMLGCMACIRLSGWYNGYADLF